jgi:hypothetical protein
MHQYVLPIRCALFVTYCVIATGCSSATSGNPDITSFAGGWAGGYAGSYLSSAGAYQVSAGTTGAGIGAMVAGAGANATGGKAAGKGGGVAGASGNRPATGGATAAGGTATTSGRGGTVASTCEPITPTACTAPQVRITEIEAGGTTVVNEDDAALKLLSISPIPSGGSRVAWMGNDSKVHITTARLQRQPYW